MKTKFIKQLNSFKIKSSHKIILALSGGIDSMVLLDLLYKSKLNFVVAHCNFSLRGQESEMDQLFIEKICQKMKLKLFVKKINTQQYATQNKISIQMAARETRYAWFRKLLKEHKCNYIFTAHHSDDSVETFLINLIRGTGIRGLQGIKSFNNDLIRPLMGFSKSDLIKYAKEHNIDYKEDGSNSDDYYVRNKIRHKIIPLMESINPSVKESILMTIQNLNNVEKIYTEFIKEQKKLIFTKRNNEFHINISALLNQLCPRQILHEIISDYGFNDIDAVFNSLYSNSGKEFFSPNFYMIKDRKNLVITKNICQDSYYVSKDTHAISEPFKIYFKSSKKSNVIMSKLKDDTMSMYLDYSKLTFPLLVRPWNDGDRFIPLGMQSFKKVSDYFVDNKFSLIQKKRARLLISSGDIVCIINERIDERYKLVENSKKVYIVST